MKKTSIVIAVSLLFIAVWVAWASIIAPPPPARPLEAPMKLELANEPLSASEEPMDAGQTPKDKPGAVALKLQY